MNDSSHLISNNSADLILIVTPPFLTETVPLGVGYLSAFIKGNGFNVDVIDLNVHLFNKSDEKNKKWWEIATIGSFTGTCLGQQFVEVFQEELWAFINRILERKERIIGFSTTAASIGVGMYLAHQIKLHDPSKIVILGGPGVYDNYHEVDAVHLVDIFVIGEGERPLLALLRRYHEQKTRESLLGI
ncbi:MAG: cobalamin B12-binding domain-containing protein, partial [Candidatus Omnitrophica bacterium]|nr:cobalamin B12-binding domain-containing protein [Candidatus Omnitrophota bacterium]